MVHQYTRYFYLSYFSVISKFPGGHLIGVMSAEVVALLNLLNDFALLSSIFLSLVQSVLPTFSLVTLNQHCKYFWTVFFLQWFRLGFVEYAQRFCSTFTKMTRLISRSNRHWSNHRRLLVELNPTYLLLVSQAHII